MIKKIKRVISFALILMLALGTLTSCFAGIGDGAMIAGVIIPPTKQTEPADTTGVTDIFASLETVTPDTTAQRSEFAQLGDIVTCKMYLVAGENPKQVRTLDGAEAVEIYRLFAEAVLQATGVNGSYINKTHIQVSFTDANGDCETFRVTSTDAFYKDQSDFSGRVDGLYSNLKGYLE